MSSLWELDLLPHPAGGGRRNTRTHERDCRTPASKATAAGPRQPGRSARPQSTSTPRICGSISKTIAYAKRPKMPPTNCPSRCRPLRAMPKMTAGEGHRTSKRSAIRPGRRGTEVILRHFGKGRQRANMSLPVTKKPEAMARASALCGVGEMRCVSGRQPKAAGPARRRSCGCEGAAHICETYHGPSGLIKEGLHAHSNAAERPKHWR